jgi:hypothetical protein
MEASSPPPLHHEVLDHPMKNQSFVESILNIGKKVTHGDRGLVLEKLNFYVPH